MNTHVSGRKALQSFKSVPQSIVIAGNSFIDPSLSSSIESADLVVRFNDCRSAQAGDTRTDVVAVCNTGRPAKAMLGSKEWRQLPAVNQASEVWCVRDPRKMRSLRPVLAVTHPELDDFCDDRTAEFVDFCKLSGKRCTVINEAIQDDVDDAIHNFRPSHYVIPSSGMVVIEYILQSYKWSTVHIVGFSHEGWELHPFAAEKQLIDHYINNRQLARL